MHQFEINCSSCFNHCVLVYHVLCSPLLNAVWQGTLLNFLRDSPTQSLRLLQTKKHNLNSVSYVKQNLAAQLMTKIESHYSVRFPVEWPFLIYREVPVFIACRH